MNYLEKVSHPDIEYIVHQCSRFISDPKKEHTHALRWLGRYLKVTQYKKTILNPKTGKDMDVYVDADFDGNWDQYESLERYTELYTHGYIVMYVELTLVWKPQF